MALRSSVRYRIVALTTSRSFRLSSQRVWWRRTSFSRVVPLGKSYPMFCLVKAFTPVMRWLTLLSVLVVYFGVGSDIVGSDVVGSGVVSSGIVSSGIADSGTVGSGVVGSDIIGSDIVGDVSWREVWLSGV